MKALRIPFYLSILTLLLSSCGYNNMVDKDETISQKWADVETQYQRRADLIPNLVNTVKGYADFEQETLTQVIEARSKATSINIEAGDLTPENIAKFQEAQGQFSSALSRLMVVIERYPDLKAVQAYRDFQHEYTEMENAIKTARIDYNESATNYNIKIKRLPNGFYSSMLGFEEKAVFSANEGSEDAPEMEDLLKRD